MDAREVVALIALLEEHDLEVYVDGGWVVGALLGRQTRPHADLDIASSHDDLGGIVCASPETFPLRLVFAAVLDCLLVATGTPSRVSALSSGLLRLSISPGKNWERFWSGIGSKSRNSRIAGFPLPLPCELAGWFDYGTLQLHGGEIVAYGLIWALMFLCVGINEEATLRGYVQRVTTDGLSMLPGSWSFWASAVLFSILFAAGHLANPGENKFGIIMVFIDGVIICFSLWRTGDLWFAIGNHAAWDWGQTFVFGTPDSGLHGQHALMNPAFHGPALFSGGTDGPEGSVLV